MLGYFRDTDLGNLVGDACATHTRLTYHRTWETGLGVAIRVTTFSPDFFVSGYLILVHTTILKFLPAERC